MTRRYKKFVLCELDSSTQKTGFEFTTRWTFRPIGVFFEKGCGIDLVINILLTLLGYIPDYISYIYQISPISSCSAILMLNMTWKYDVRRACKIVICDCRVDDMTKWKILLIAKFIYGVQHFYSMNKYLLTREISNANTVKQWENR
uniref:Ion_trans domain-containing protein n=1 Tax=Elaeophora elaphi TaxID=1147741 RepID=A0A0R3RK52_9BILA